MASHAAATGIVDDGLAIAGADGKSSQVQKVSVEIINDADNEARRLALETEAQSRRYVHGSWSLLPSQSVSVQSLSVT